MQISLEPAGAIPVKVQNNIFHTFDLVERELERDIELLILEGFLIYFWGNKQGLIIEETWRSDKHIAEGLFDTIRAILLNFVNEWTPRAIRLAG